MPIRIRSRNKNSASAEPPDILGAMPDPKNYLLANHSAKVTAFGGLDGSLYALLPERVEARGVQASKNSNAGSRSARLAKMTREI